MNTCLVRDQGRFSNHVQLEDISEYIKVADNFVWLDVMDPNEDDIALLREEFDFHPLSLEDAVKQNQRPKVEEYPNYFFLVAHALRFDRERLEVQLSELDVFVGRNFVVTVHKDPILALAEALIRAEKNPEMLGTGVGSVVYHIMDSVIDDYMPALDQLDDQIDEIEEGIFHHFRDDAIEDIFKLKRELLSVRRTTGHLRDVFNILCRRDNPLFTPQQIIYFQDIYDHLYRVTDQIDIYRDVLTGALEAYLSLNANKLNNIMKAFAGWSIILMTAALVAGIYGMNFENMPELKLAHGYYGALASMIVLGGVELAIFRKKGWL